jgi:hypothetical protein
LWKCRTRRGRARSAADPQVGISEQPLYRWKNSNQELEADQLRQLRHPRDANGRLKQMAAELMLAKTMLQECCQERL